VHEPFANRTAYLEGCKGHKLRMLWQVASHAQKYFIRLNSMNKKDKRRSSIHDITTPAGPSPGATALHAVHASYCVRPIAHESLFCGARHCRAFILPLRVERPMVHEGLFCLQNILQENLRCTTHAEAFGDWTCWKLWARLCCCAAALSQLNVVQERV